MAATGANLVAQQNLQSALAKCSAAIDSLMTNPRPNYSIDGRSFQWNELLESLIKQQKELLVAIQNLENPFEVVAIGN